MACAGAWSNASCASASKLGTPNAAIRAPQANALELWFTDWEFKGVPWEHPELYEKWSPSNFVQNVKTPMLVVEGALDFRVADGQAFQIFTALQRRGVPSELLYFPDEGHWVLKPQNSQLWYKTVLAWLDQHLSP